MGKIRARPMIHRRESLEAPGNEADIARMFQTLQKRTGGDVSVTAPQMARDGRSVAVGAASTENTQPGLPFAPAGLSRESPGSSSTEATATADGGYIGTHVSFPPLAIGTDSATDQAVAPESRLRSQLAVPSQVVTEGHCNGPGSGCEAGPSTSTSLAPSVPALQWEKPVEGATAVKTTDGRYSCCKVIIDGRARYEAWKLIPAGTWFRPLAQNLNSFAAARVICEEDLNR